MKTQGGGIDSQLQISAKFPRSSQSICCPGELRSWITAGHSTRPGESRKVNLPQHIANAGHLYIWENEHISTHEKWQSLTLTY